jgi:hypothetical protein
MDDERPGEVAERRAINRLVHGVLLAGGGLAALLLIISVVASLVERRALPVEGMGFLRVWRSLKAGHPGGLAVLGLLVLVATPPLRVLGSVVAFIVEKDFRYALVTLLVFGLMVLSFFLGVG